MKAPTFILTVLMLLSSISFLPGNSKVSNVNVSEQRNTVTTKAIYADYTYVRVFKNGIWWIYVYDGSVLIDVYPE